MTFAAPEPLHVGANPLSARVAEVRALQISGRLQDAALRLDALCRDYPDDVGVLQLAARVAGQQGRYDLAETHLQRAWGLAPRHASLACDMGRLVARGGALESSLLWFERAVDLEPSAAEARFFLGMTLLRLGRASEAIPSLRFANSAMPAQPEVLLALADAEFQGGDDDAALVTIAALLQKRPDDEHWLLRYGEVLARLGRHAEATAHFEASVARLPALAGAWMALAQAREESGDADGAEAAYRRALAIRQDWPQPLAGLLSLRRGQAGSEEMAAAARLLASSVLDASDTALLAYPLGRVHDARAEHRLAMQAWRQANEAREREVGSLDIARFEAGVAAQLLEPLPQVLMRQPATLPPPGLVFVVGMPRSGTTLVEQVLDAHAAVSGCGELPFFADLAARYPSPGDLDDEQASAEARRYRELAGRIGASDARFWVDKAPLNAFHLGHVARLFPDAKILWCRRDARDVGLSIFSENFSKAATFSTSLVSIAACIRAQHRVMRHWQKRLGLPVLEVAYETMVEDLPGSVRRLLDFCSLPWDEACLAFHRSGRVVQTPSRWQVRRPVHRGSIGRWQAYESELRPLVDALELAPDIDGVPRT